MDLWHEQIPVLATALLEADAVALPDRLACSPLDLLVELHARVREAMLSDPALAARAAAVARQLADRFSDNPLHHAQAHWSTGSAILFLPDYVGALAHYDEALAWYERARSFYAPAEPPRDVRAVEVVRVFCLSELGRYAEAQLAAAAAARWLSEHPNPYAELTLLLNRSQLAGRMGAYGEMLDLADATIALAKEQEFGDREAQGWLNRAIACCLLGLYAEAEAAITQAQTLAAVEDETFTVARARVCRAWLLNTRGQLFAALTELHAAAAAFAQAPGETATVLLEEAQILAQLHQWPEALVAARQAATLFAGQAMPVYSAEAALQAVRIAVRLGQQRAARQLLERARSALQGGNHPLLEPTLALAEAQIATLPAPELAPAALRRTRQRAHREAVRASASLAHAGFELAAAEGQLIVAALAVQLDQLAAARVVYAALLDHPQPTIRHEAHSALGALLPPAEAFAHLQIAAELAVLQRRTLPMEELQARYSGETAAVQMRLARCALALGMLEQAASAIWEAKAGPILDLRASTAADSATSSQLAASKTELARLRRLADEHTRAAYLANSEQQYERADYHLEQARTFAAAAQAHGASLTASLRTLADRGGERSVPDLDAIQSALPAGAALLEWFQVDEALCAMLVRPEGAPIFRTVTDTRVVARLLDRWSLVVHRYQGVAQHQGADALRQALRPLVELLLGQWRDDLVGLDALVVAPCGVLYQLPWPALLSELAEDVAVSLTPSGGLWAAPAEQATMPPGPPRILGAAGEGHDRLGHVEVELDTIAARLPVAVVKIQATTADLRAAPAPALLHIAAHGRTDAAAPLCSTLELADAPFLLLEAHRLDLRGTALVVLSACETSVRPDHGDMVLALAGAFLCAGAGAVVASLWRVDDAATAELMGELYGALAAGLAPVAALRHAQQTVRKRYPLDWTAFQLWVGTAAAAQEPLSLRAATLGSRAVDS